MGPPPIAKLCCCAPRTRGGSRPSYELTRDVRVVVLRDTTGEARRLQITGRANGDGVLAAGTRIDTPRGTVVAEGTAADAIAAAKASASLEGKTPIHPPDDSMPEGAGQENEMDQAPIKHALIGYLDNLLRQASRYVGTCADFLRDGSQLRLACRLILHEQRSPYLGLDNTIHGAACRESVVGLPEWC